MFLLSAPGLSNCDISIWGQIRKARVSYAVFRLERFTEVREFTYPGKHFPSVNAN